MPPTASNDAANAIISPLDSGNVLRTVQRARLVEIDEDTNEVVLTPPGIQQRTLQFTSTP